MAWFNWRSREHRREVYQVIALIIAALALSHAIGWWPYGSPVPEGSPMNPDTFWRIIFIVALLSTGLFFYLGRRVSTSPAIRDIPGKDQQPSGIAALPATRSPSIKPALPVGEYSKNLRLHGLDGVDLLIYPSGDGCRCKLLNGTLSIVRAFQVMIAPVRSFDLERLMWSDPIPFRGMMGPTTTPTNPREFTQEFNFVAPQQNGLRIGDHAESILTWPSGDSAPVQRWRIPIVVFAHPVVVPGRPSDPKSFGFEICLRWTPGQSFEFMEYADTVPPTSV
jgi:hypothetical protein